MAEPFALDLTDPVALTAQLIDIPSVSGEEKRIADIVWESLSVMPHLHGTRDGDSMILRTELGRDRRVIVAGHLDTVPPNGNQRSRVVEVDGVESVWGRGSVDMKGGVAAAVVLAAELTEPTMDVTWVFYDHEEVATHLSGLGRLVRNHAELLEADMAILGEPTAANIEGGCNGTVRVIGTIKGVAAHSARAWKGDNAIHRAAPVVERIAAFGNPVVPVDGLDYRESMSVVGISAGGAMNVIPDSVRIVVNYRFAPSMTGAEAVARVEQMFDGSGAELVADDIAEGARPGLDSPIVQTFLDAAGDVPVGPKYGWTDVSRFSALGMPALNYGPGDPELAHTDDEAAPIEQITACTDVLRRWLS